MATNIYNPQKEDSRNQTSNVKGIGSKSTIKKEFIVDIQPFSKFVNKKINDKSKKNDQNKSLKPKRKESKKI